MDDINAEHCSAGHPDRERSARIDEPAPDEVRGDALVCDDESLLAAARRLVRRGFVRRLWILLIEADGTLLPQLQQVDGTPASPDAYAVMALRRILDVVAAADVEVAFVLERPGGRSPAPDDWAWHDAIVRAAREQAVPLRGLLLAHTGGVDLLEPPRTLAA